MPTPLGKVFSMSSKRVVTAFLATAALGSVSIGLVSSPATARPPDSSLEMYSLEGPADKISEAVPGLELAALHHTTAGVTADAVLTKAQRKKLDAAGV